MIGKGTHPISEMIDVLTEALPTKREMGSRSVSMQLSSLPAEPATKTQLPSATTQPVPAASTCHAPSV